MALDPARKAYLDALQETLTQQTTQMNTETRKDLATQVAQLNSRIEPVNVTTRSELGTLIEEVHGDVKLLAEAVAIHNELSLSGRTILQSRVWQRNPVVPGLAKA